MSSNESIVLKQDLLSALKLAHLFSDTFNQISVSCIPSKKILELKTKNSNIGENTNRLNSVIKGEEIIINFNHRYIIDAFQAIPVASVSLNFNGLSKPMVMRGVGDKSFTYLVMPMNK